MLYAGLLEPRNLISADRFLQLNLVLALIGDQNCENVPFVLSSTRYPPLTAKIDKAVGPIDSCHSHTKNLLEMCLVYELSTYVNFNVGALGSPSELCFGAGKSRIYRTSVALQGKSRTPKRGHTDLEVSRNVDPRAALETA